MHALLSHSYDNNVYCVHVKTSFLSLRVAPPLCMALAPPALAPQCFSVPVEDGVLQLQLIDLGSQARPQHVHSS